MSILFAGGGTFDILAKVPSETLLNMAAVIDHQFKKHTVQLEEHSRSPFSKLPVSYRLIRTLDSWENLHSQPVSPFGNNFDFKILRHHSS